MEFSEFILAIEKCGFGIAAFNTYYQNDVNHYFMVVVNKWHIAVAIKVEGTVDTMCGALDEVVKEIVDITGR